MARNRTREKTSVQGAGTVVDTVANETYDQFVEVSWKRTEDTIEKKVRDDGSLPTSALLVHEVDRRGYGTISGTKGRWNFHNRPYYSDPGASSLSIWNEIEESADDYVSRLLANTNPFRSEISVPVLVWELVEATSLLRFKAASFLQFAGGGYLNALFGWSTLISDIQTLAGITQDIERRVLEFNSLVKKGGLRRKMKLGGGSKTVSGTNYPVHSAYTALVYANWTRTYTSKVWGSVRWRPKRKDIIPVDKLAQFNLAVRQVFDLEAPDPATIWEAIPFSWLIDYFTTVGNMLKAIENSDLVEPYDICIMRTREITCSYTPTSIPAGLSATKGVGIRRLKSRTLHSWSVSELLGFTFLVNKDQATTILALLASNRR